MLHSRGLSSVEVKRLREKFGWNELTVKKPEALYRKFLRQFSDILIIVLILAGLIALAFGETLDAIVILCIVLINAVIGFLQEYKTERMLEALQKLVAPTARVIRDGKAVNILSREVVPGDLLILEEGARVPADAQLIEANELRVDEAILTGESVPVSKFLCQKESENCLIYSGTTIAAGSGRALVKNIGANTEFGRVAALTTGLKKSASPLTKEMKKIGTFVGKVALILSVLLFAIGYFYQNLSLIHSLLFSVAVAVAAVPEGLPVTITTALALGMRRLAEKKALVRDLKSVETLGGTTVICSDKTGTLTRNQMTVTRGWLAQEGEFAVTGSGYNPKSGRVELKKGVFAAPLLFQIADFCNEANLVKKSSNWMILGDPTEGALKVVARKYGLRRNPPNPPYQGGLSRLPLKTFPFDSDRKRMSVIYGSRLLSKGAPEQLLEVCTHYYDGKKVQKLDQKKRAEISKQTTAFANQALRVLGFAYRDLRIGELKQLNTTKAERNLVFVGLLGMRDAPRPEVSEAVRLCQKAGIRITVVTGDNGLTAAAIAREIGIADKLHRFLLVRKFVVLVMRN
jgi:Ca2+-transporting ATPase